MSLHMLVLFPKNPYIGLVDREDFIRRLQEIGFLGEVVPWRRWDGRIFYSAGERFAEYIQFHHSHVAVTGRKEYGSAETSLVPSVELVSEIDVRDVTNKPGLMAGENVADPRCPYCHRHVTDWPDILDAWHERLPDFLWTCPACAHPSAPYQWDWDTTAGIARYFITIEGIYEREAVPTSSLLDVFHGLTGEAWDYCFVHL